MTFYQHPNGFLGRCATNTETSAVKQPAGATPNQAWQRCSFFIEAVQPLKSAEGAKWSAWWRQRSRRSGFRPDNGSRPPALIVPARSQPWFVWRRVLCAPSRLAASIHFHFFNTAVADKQCTGLQNPQMWARYPPAVPFSEWCNLPGCSSCNSASKMLAPLSGPWCQKAARLPCKQQATERYRPGPPISIVVRATCSQSYWAIQRIAPFLRGGRSLKTRACL